jgi:hypothetical protein
VDQYERRARPGLLVPELLPTDVCERHGDTLDW